MGSTGSGSFSDYPASKPSSNKKNGGSSGDDNCGKAFRANVEELNRCKYLIDSGTTPPKGTEVFLTFKGTRIVVETRNKVEIGYLPTKYNYLKMCMEDGFNYEGVVVSSATSPIATVQVDIVPL